MTPRFASLALGVPLLLLLALLQPAPSAAYFYPEADPKQLQSILDGSTHVLLEFYAPWCGHCKKLAPHYQALGEELEDDEEVSIVMVDADKYKQASQKFGVSGFPTLKWMPKGKMLPGDAETVEAERTKDGLKEFIFKRLGRKFRKAESLVKKVTDASIKSVIADTSKARMIEFYAPWCGHCKALAPKYDKVAELYHDEPSVYIGALDGDAYKESLTDFGIKGFPMLKFFPAGSTEPVDYDGAREVDDIVEYINSQAGTDVSPKGGVVDGAGVVEELSDAVEKFAKAEDDAARKAARAEAAAVLEKLEAKDKKNGEYYIKVMDKSIEKGIDYLANEHARLEKVLVEKKGSLKLPQRRSFERRVNVLGAFKDEL